MQVDELISKIKFWKKCPEYIQNKQVNEQFLNIINNRRSVRKYIERPVSDDLIEKIITAGTFAPSASNRQPWEFIIVTRTDLQEKIAEACAQEWMRSAPVFIIVCINMKIASASYGERGEKLFGIQSTAAAIENIFLAAESLGLNTCWIGSFSEHKISILAQCPDYIRPCAVLTLGYGAEKPEAPERFPIDQICHRNVFGEKWEKKLLG